MRWIYSIPIRLRAILLPRRIDRELDDEFQFHFEQQVEANLAQGMTPSAARATAAKQLNRTTVKKEECRDIRGLNFIDSVAQDLRYAARMLFRNAASTTVMVLALAIGIAVNTSVFTAYKAVFARPLDARNPAEMVNIALIRDSGASDPNFSYPDYENYRDATVHSFSGLIAYKPGRVTLSNDGGITSGRAAAGASGLERLGLMLPSTGNAEFAGVNFVSENYFQVLGVPAMQGRTFDAMTIPELLTNPPALISENYWRRRFNGDAAILGKIVHLNGLAVTIIGITPRDFVGTGMSTAAFILPLRIEPLMRGDDQWLRQRENRCCRLVGRLAPGVGIAQAQSEMNRATDQVRTLHDPRTEAARPATVLVWPGSPFPLPISQFGGLVLTILLIMIAAGMVLAVACANVGGLQLARARGRQHELKTRLSLGASRSRIIRQLITESALLGLLAGVFAFGFTFAFWRVAVTLIVEALPAEHGSFIFNVNPDLEIFAYAFAVSLAAGILAGLAPAMESSRSALTSAGLGRGTTPRLQNALVATQVALSLVLMIAGSMLIRSSLHSLNMDPGYDAKRVITVELQFPETSKYTLARRLEITRELRTRLAAIPGAAAITSARLPVDRRFRTAAVALDAASPAQAIFHYAYVEANYFQTLGIPLLLGQGFENADGIVISESVAKQLWPGQNPIGRSLRLGATDEKSRHPSELFADGPARQVVGVARDKRAVEFGGSDSKEVYLPRPEGQFLGLPILLRTQSAPAQIVRAIEPIIASVDPAIVATSATLEEMLRLSGPFVVSSFAAVIASTVGLIGLVLALMGIYGTVSYIVVLRTREVGIRMAIGAQKRDVLGLILRESARPVIAGLMVGMCLAVAAGYLARGFFFGLGSVDTISVVGVSTLFLTIALVASYPPARRATRVDPMVALRYE